MKKVSVIAAAVAATLVAGSALAEDKVNQGWQVNGYGHLLYNAGESLSLSDTWAHRDAYRAAGAAFSGNPNQVEFTVTRGDNYESGAWSKYVLKTEYGNNEDHPSFGNGRGFYGSSSGSEGWKETGQLEFKEAYVELGDLSMFKEGTSIWAGKRYLNRQAGIITKEFWKQSSGVGAGLQYNNMGLAVVSADPGVSYDGKSGNLTAQNESTTMTSVDAYIYGIEALGGRFDFDVKVMTRAHQEDSSTNADDGVGAGITYSRDYYGFDGWSLTAITFGKGLGAIKGLNFGQWSNMTAGDESLFFTSYGVANISENFQVGSEIVYWDISNDSQGSVWGSKDGLSRMFIGVTPSYKVNENMRIETVLTYGRESLGEDGTWDRENADANFYSATLAPVFTVNADYFGRPQIKPYVTYMTSSESTYTWSNGGSDSETRFGVEAEIWF